MNCKKQMLKKGVLIQGVDFQVEKSNLPHVALKPPSLDPQTPPQYTPQAVEECDSHEILALLKAAMHWERKKHHRLEIQAQITDKNGKISTEQALCMRSFHSASDTDLSQI